MKLGSNPVSGPTHPPVSVWLLGLCVPGRCAPLLDPLPPVFLRPPIAKPTTKEKSFLQGYAPALTETVDASLAEQLTL